MWSLLSPTPGLYYEVHTDSYIVFWNGIATTHSAALVLATSVLMHVPVTPKIKDDIFTQFKKAYYSGAFGNVDWDIKNYSAHGYFTFLSNQLGSHIHEKVPDVSASEVLRWFDKRNIIGEIK